MCRHTSPSRRNTAIPFHPTNNYRRSVSLSPPLISQAAGGILESTTMSGYFKSSNMQGLIKRNFLHIILNVHPQRRSRPMHDEEVPAPKVTASESHKQAGRENAIKGEFGWELAVINGQVQVSTSVTVKMCVKSDSAVTMGLTWLFIVRLIGSCGRCSPMYWPGELRHADHADRGMFI